MLKVRLANGPIAWIGNGHIVMQHLDDKMRPVIGQSVLFVQGFPKMLIQESADSLAAQIDDLERGVISAGVDNGSE